MAKQKVLKICKRPASAHETCQEVPATKKPSRDTEKAHDDDHDVDNVSEHSNNSGQSILLHNKDTPRKMCNVKEVF